MLNLEFSHLVHRYRWLSVGHLADDGSGLAPFAGVIDSAPGGAASA